ncbi:unnamed protein product [Clonostachys solani]|uniref:Cytochrome b n=1 Tax=Clonostachys solani TaxID=160281 RepID=A0A9N9ZJT8_9HYPO|nr:unnamed protein product [Clonostachys solani]
MKSEYCEERRNLVIGMLLAKQPNSSIACATHRKKLSSETIEAMRHSALNREKFQYSDEALLNSSFSIACAAKQRSTKNSKPIIVKELNGIVYGEYNSITETAEALNCSAKTVYRALKSSIALVLAHLIAVHESAGASNPLGVPSYYDRIPFAPYYLFKDLITIFIFFYVLSIFVFFMPNVLGDSDNYIPANPMQTPAAIVPE